MKTVCFVNQISIHAHIVNTIDTFDIILILVGHLQQFFLANKPMCLSNDSTSEVDRSSNRYFVERARFNNALSRKPHKANQLEDTTLQACTNKMDTEPQILLVSLVEATAMSATTTCAWLYLTVTFTMANTLHV